MKQTSSVHSGCPHGSTRAYQVVSLSGYYQPLESVGPFVALENNNYEYYRYLGSGVNEPGINVVPGTQMHS